MKAHLLLADAATAHQDNTFSLLRGGISNLNVPKNRPCGFKGSLVARIVADRGEAGPHEFKVKCVTEDGGSILPEATATFEIPQAGGSVHLVLDMQLIFPKPGRYEFSITVDKHQMDSLPFDVIEVSEGAHA